VVWSFCPPAVRADRMRGGRNKFGPFYRRERQLKQQIYYQPGAAPYRIKTEATRAQPPAPHGDDLMMSHWNAPSYQPHAAYPSGFSQPCGSLLGSDTGPYHPSFPQEENTEYPFGMSSALGNSSSCSPSSAAGDVFSPLSPAASSTSASTSTSDLHPPADAPPADDFLSRLLKGEPEEGRLCAKVLASLQREQANRGKHDCLNTFSIMCKMADLTLFGLVEWARNSAIFKDLQVRTEPCVK